MGLPLPRILASFLHVFPLFQPKNDDFVIFMQFLPKPSLPTSQTYFGNPET